MTKNDMDLIQEAYEKAPCEWMIVFAMIKKADTDEAKQKLKSICNRLFYTEEFESGVL